MPVLKRFLKYVSFDTQSDDKTGLTPSTPGQMIFAQYLSEELRHIGISDVKLDRNGYVMATLPTNVDKEVPTIGFIAHIDTSPEMSGRKVQPRIVEKYNGEDIVLDECDGVVLKTKDFPEILNYVGQDIVVTNGKTLLGSDDKAGIAEIMSALDYLIQHPEVKHGKIRVAFTPDEEIGQGATKFNVEEFGAAWAYTIDGGQIGELQYENFNAATARLQFHGRNVHPGYAKHKMINSMRIANQFITMLPRHETPEHTEDYEGFFHLTQFEGKVELSTLTYIIRDFDRDRFERRKKELEHLVRKINAEYGEGSCDVYIVDQYYNMKEIIEPKQHIIDLAREAMIAADVEVKELPIRGGTDGSQLSYKNLPCPNIFSGGHNFHGRFEFIPIPSMQKAVEVIVKIAEKAVDLKI
ncbi:MAG: peptidase T [Prevotellaceae bacterium]|jgi:tripeptide aminopeptidase|nr:peptidase T [Prevotellaceae bacterium]